MRCIYFLKQYVERGMRATFIGGPPTNVTPEGNFSTRKRHTRLAFRPLNFFCQLLNKIYRVSSFLAPSHPAAIRSDFTLPSLPPPSFPPFILFDQTTIQRSLPRTIVKQCQHVYALSRNNAEIWMCTSFAKCAAALWKIQREKSFEIGKYRVSRPYE